MINAHGVTSMGIFFSGEYPTLKVIFLQIKHRFRLIVIQIQHIYTPLCENKDKHSSGYLRKQSEKSAEETTSYSRKTG